MKKLYQLPLFERVTDISIPVGSGSKVKCLHIDKVGIFVSYDDEKKLKPRFIRRHLIGIEDTHCIVEANNPKEAIEIFFQEWEGAKVGGKGEKRKALRINREQPIFELPFCHLLRKNKEDEFICGDPLESGLESGNGEFGMCVLEGYDAPEDCPIGKFSEVLYEAEKKGEQPIEVIKFQKKKYKVVRAKSLATVST